MRRNTTRVGVNDVPLAFKRGSHSHDRGIEAKHHVVHTSTTVMHERRIYIYVYIFQRLGYPSKLTQSQN